MAASLGGIDMLALTGGIGEHDAATVESIRIGLAWLTGLRVSTIALQEDDQIARHASLLGPPGSGGCQTST